MGAAEAVTEAVMVVLGAPIRWVWRRLWAKRWRWRQWWRRMEGRGRWKGYTEGGMRAELENFLCQQVPFYAQRK